MSETKPALSASQADTAATPLSSTSSTPSMDPLPRPIPVSSPSRKRKASPTPSPKQAKKKTPGRPKGGSPTTDWSANGKTTGAWRREEVRALWDAMSLIPTSTKWDEVASKVPGRDKISCRNKWRYDMLPKLQAFIDSLGE